MRFTAGESQDPAPWLSTVRLGARPVRSQIVRDLGKKAKRTGVAANPPLAAAKTPYVLTGSEHIVLKNIARPNRIGAVVRARVQYGIPGRCRRIRVAARRPGVRVAPDAGRVNFRSLCDLAKWRVNLRISRTDLRTLTSSNSLPKLPRLGFSTERGQMIVGGAEQVFASGVAKKLRGKVQLIFTSPPFPLNRKKKYGNLSGEEYVQWLAAFAPRFRELLKPNGSIVLELGNAWEPGKPVMSTLALKALLAFLERGGFHLCQQFICYNPARLPSPAQWVNVDRIRVKDSYTHVWWMAPSEEPLADNRRVLRDYSPSMQKLLTSKNYNSGKRPSGHHIGKKSFLRNNNGAIPPNVLVLTNTKSTDDYQRYCRKKHLPIHPARMPNGLPEFFIKFLTVPGNLVLDPFAGSNTTGAVAERLKRRWLAIEPRPDYAAGARGRFQTSINLNH